MKEIDLAHDGETNNVTKAFDVDIYLNKVEEEFVRFETAMDTVDGADRQRHVLQDFAALQVVNLQYVFHVLKRKWGRATVQIW